MSIASTLDLSPTFQSASPWGDEPVIAYCDIAGFDAFQSASPWGDEPLQMDDAPLYRKVSIRVSVGRRTGVGEGHQNGVEVSIRVSVGRRTTLIL